MSAPKPPPLETGLLMAMQALDNQISREVNQRDPSAREVHGVQKWAPIDKRVERVSSLIMDSLGDNEITLDSILVLSQSFVKSLCLISSELGEEGLGEVRVEYVKEAIRRIGIELERTRTVIDNPGFLS